jgi:hypothetical protein
MSSTAMSGAKVSASRTAADPSWATAVRQPSSSNIVARLIALSTLSSTTSTRMPSCGSPSPGRWRCWASAATPAIVGTRTVKREPRFSPALSTRTLPPCISTSFFTSARPMPSPPCVPLEAAVDLREHVEHARQHVLRNAESRILDRDDRVTRVARRAEDDPAAVGRVLGRVVEQVGDHLDEPGRVRPHRQRLRRRQAQHELVAALLDQRPARLDRVLQHRQQVDALGAKLDLALRDAADVEQVVDEVDHLLELRSIMVRALSSVCGSPVRRMISSA